MSTTKVLIAWWILLGAGLMDEAKDLLLEWTLILPISSVTKRISLAFATWMLKKNEQKD